MQPRHVFHLCLWGNLAIVAFAVIHGLSVTGNPSRYFGEGRYTTAISCLQLLLTAYLAFRICKVRRSLTRCRGSIDGSWLWALIGAGFVFLALDDALQIHERMDKLVLHVFHLEKNGITDRIDDAIIATYGAIGLLVLWWFYPEWSRFRPMLKPLAIGFVFLVLNVLCDALSNREDIFMWLSADRGMAKKLDGWFSVGDGAFQLLAEGMFVAAFYAGFASAAQKLPVEDLQATA